MYKGRLAAALLLVPWLATSGCEGCRQGAVLAELERIEGTVERDHAKAIGQWEPGTIGHKFSMGDGVRTAAEARARLKLRDGSGVRIEPKTLLRFQDAPPEEQSVDVQFGDVTFETGNNAVRLRSPIGLAVLEPNTQFHVTRQGKAVQMEVVVGMAKFDAADGQSAQITAGKGIRVDIDTAKLEPLAPVESPPAPEPDEVAEPEPDAEAAPAEDAIAAHVTGKGVRYRASPEERWNTLGPGQAEVTEGGELRIPTRGHVTLTRGKERATLDGAGRFTVGGENGSLARAITGGVTLERPGSDTRILVPGGSIVVKVAGGHADARLNVDNRSRTKLQVRAGEVQVNSGHGSDRVTAGETLALMPDGSMSVEGRGPEIADFVVNAGDSFVVHDPSPPTVIAISFAGLCPSGGSVRIGRRVLSPRGDDKDKILAVFPPGSQRYQVNCEGAAAAAAAGGVQILRDRGTQQLPRTAPASIVDADGRKYTILYQNLLPEIRFTWPGAPKAGTYTVEVKTGNQVKRVSAAKARLVFKSSQLPEGTHELTFIADADTADERRSPATVAKIRFDNAAPTAVVQAPHDRFVPEGKVPVAGIALPGWAVTAMGQALTLDDHFRFSGEVPVDPSQRAISIRFQHDDRGVHYYLRRPGKRR